MSDFDRVLAPLGRTNFGADGAVDGVPARIVMNDREIGLAVADGTGTLSRAPFADAAAVRAADDAVDLRVADRRVTVRFEDAELAERLVRVLQVRQDMGGTPSGDGSRPGPARPRTTHPRARTPDAQWRQWTGYLLLAGGVTLAAGWIGLAAGLLLGVVAAGNGNTAAAVVWLVGAALGSAVPLCLGTLARTVALRYQAEQHAHDIGA